MEFINDITVNIKKVYGRNVGLYEVGAGSGSLGCGIKVSDISERWDVRSVLFSFFFGRFYFLC